MMKPETVKTIRELITKEIALSGTLRGAKLCEVLNDFLDNTEPAPKKMDNGRPPY